MSEGTIQETLIAAFSVVLVLTAVGAILYRIVIGDGQSRRLDKLKRDLEANKK